LFIAPLQHDFGWTRTSISLGITIITIGTALSSLLVGIVVDRIGERVLIATGMLALAGGYIGLSLMGGSISVFWTIMALMALFGAGCSAVTLSRIIVGMFDQHRGAALGAVLIGTGLTGALGPVMLAPVIAAEGWRAGYQVLALVMIIGLPIVVGLLVFNRVGSARLDASGRSQEQPLAGMTELARQPILLRLLIPVVCVAIGTGGVVVHFVPMLIDAGYSPSRAGQMAGLVGLSLVSSRLIVGITLDHIFAPLVATSLMAVSALGFLGISITGSSLLPWTSMLTGMSLGAEVDLIAYLVSRYFPATQFGRAYGLLYGAFLTTVALSPVVYARFREWNGDYTAAFVWAAAFLAASSICFAMLPRFPKPAGSQVSA
jgi:MFS family permease